MLNAILQQIISVQDNQKPIQIINNAQNDFPLQTAISHFSINGIIPCFLLQPYWHLLLFFKIPLTYYPTNLWVWKPFENWSSIYYVEKWREFRRIDLATHKKKEGRLFLKISFKKRLSIFHELLSNSWFKYCRHTTRVVAFKVLELSL